MWLDLQDDRHLRTESVDWTRQRDRCKGEPNLCCNVIRSRKVQPGIPCPPSFICRRREMGEGLGRFETSVFRRNLHDSQTCIVNLQTVFSVLFSARPNPSVILPASALQNCHSSAPGPPGLLAVNLAFLSDLPGWKFSFRWRVWRPARQACRPDPSPSPGMPQVMSVELGGGGAKSRVNDCLRKGPTLRFASPLDPDSTKCRSKNHNPCHVLVSTGVAIGGLAGVGAEDLSRYAAWEAKFGQTSGGGARGLS